MPTSANSTAPTMAATACPPSLLATALLLQTHDKVSDTEAKARADFDIRWKVALGIEIEDRPFGKSTLQVFRASCGPGTNPCLIGGGKIRPCGRVIADKRLSMFRINVRLIAQQKCPSSGPQCYQRMFLWELRESDVSAGCRRRRISLPCLCGFLAPSPFREWTAPSAWPPVLLSTFLSEEKSASAPKRKLSLQPRPPLQRPGRSPLPHPSLPSAVPGALPVNQPDPWDRRPGRQY